MKKNKRSNKAIKSSGRRGVKRLMRPEVNLTKSHIKNVFRFAVEHAGDYDPAQYEYKGGDEPITRKPSQMASNEKCFGQTFSLDYRPTASGKGYAIRFLAVMEAIANNGMKVLICCPSIQITSDFIPTENPMRLRLVKDDPTSDKFFNPTWSTLGYTDEGSIKELYKFLTTPIVGDHNAQICITTHQTLVQTYDQHQSAFRNVLIIVDEAHHILYHRAEDETLEEWAEEGNEPDENTNKLGALIEFAMEHPDANIRLHMATATFGRGDKLNVIPAKYRDKLVVYRMGFSEFLRTECKYLKGFTYGFGLYLNSPLEVLMESMKTWKKSLCYISSGDPELKEGKVLDYLQAITQNEKVVRPPEREDGTIVVMRDGKPLVIVILVDELGREKKYKYIKQAHEDPNIPLDAVISLRTFIEGASLKTLERLYFIGHKRSAIQVQQCLGRLFRDCEGKEIAEIIHILPEPYIFNRKKNIEDTTLEKYGDYLKSICFLLDQLEIHYSSAALPQRPVPRLPKDEMDDDDSSPTNLLMAEVGNNGRYDTISKNLMVALINGAMSEMPSAEWLPEFKLEAKDILTKSGVAPEKMDDIITDYLTRMKKRTQTIIEGNVGSIDPELLREIKLVSGYEYIGGLLFISSNQVDIELLEKIRECLRKKFDEVWAEVKRMVESGEIAIPDSMADDE